ncbi:unnamed protein product [Notodromas monacha]|uniref:RNA helicase n=1 Tax=Notodromas monacha TaxID=399045 RepID=A0A7R9BKS2_9CRUS|nr:unnamed protein product [Notodromas monacha]CAG0915799.1 unnamed protein product [Notodromas monacha]
MIGEARRLTVRIGTVKYFPDLSWILFITLSPPETKPGWFALSLSPCDLRIIMSDVRIELGDVTPQNIKQLKMINQVVFPVSYNDKFYRDVLEAGELAKLSYYNDIIVGAVCCRVDVVDGQRRLYIMTLGCLAPYRRHGIGTKMLEHVLAFVEKDGNFDSVFLHVQISNEGAINFYKKFGFEIIETKDHYYKRIEPADAHVLAKSVRKGVPQVQEEEEEIAADVAEAPVAQVRGFDDVHSSNADQERPPPHLKGREIGMWYAARSKAKKDAPAHENIEEMMTVMLPNETEDSLEETLKFIDRPQQSNEEGWQGCRDLMSASGSSHFVDRYNHVKDSSFKNQFLDNLKQNKCAGGEDMTTDEEEPIKKRFMAAGLSKNPELDRKIKSEFDQKRTSDRKYQRMAEFRSRLPSHDMQEQILGMIEKHQVVVLSGETGCGKTTQVPQYILDHYIESERASECRIICTQPRRISAISVAERVAQERGESCGRSSGFQIRLQATLPKSTGSILYCTTGILVTKMQSDPLLKEYSHIVLDEIHERDVLSDFLLALTKDVLANRPNLRVVLMSATLNAELFSEYFGKCPVLHIPGLTFPVEEFYLEDIIKLTGLQITPDQGRRGGFRPKRPQQKELLEYKTRVLPVLKEILKRERYPACVMRALESPACETQDALLEAAVETIKFICENEGDGAILVFFPGWEEISKLSKLLNADRFFGRGVRKIIIATNIAETSITIDDVVFVINSGKIKMTTFDPQLNIQALDAVWVSRANARQRKGRAGRVQPGKCFHLYSRARETTFSDFLLPEIKRMRLEELCLQIKLLKLGKIADFLSKVIEPPTKNSLELSIKLLRDLNALDKDENLTPLGFHLAKLPTDPQTGKMLLMGAIFSCLDPVTTIAAVLAFKDPFHGKEREVMQCKMEFSAGLCSDHIMFAKAFEAWEEASKEGHIADRMFCRENFMSGNTLSMIRDMKKQLAGYLKEMGFLADGNPKHAASNKNSGKMGLVRAVVCAGLYPNIAHVRLRRNRNAPVAMRTPEDNQTVHFHSKSVLVDEKDYPSPWIVYKMKQRTARVSLFDASVASPCSLLFFGKEVKSKPVPKMGNIRSPKNHQVLSADEYVKFKSSERIAHFIQRLRLCLDDLLDYKITHPGPSRWELATKEKSATKEEKLLRAIVELLTAEAEISGLGYADDDDEDEPEDTFNYDEDFDRRFGEKGRSDSAFDTSGRMRPGRGSRF